jgi:hypothetical protein
MLRVAFAGIDLARDTVIVTADHGHVAPGGHGGVEPEISRVPLVLAGNGIVPGATAHDARLIDVAPTVAALLGLPAPRQAEGRALVELLALSPADAARRAITDIARGRTVAAIADAARAAQPRPDPLRLAALAAGLALTAGLIVAGRRRGVVAVTWGSLAGALGLPVMALALVAITRGQLSPSYVPSLARTQQLGAAGVVIALGVQLWASWRVVRRAPDPRARAAAATGLAVVGLGTALGAVALARAWYAPPHLDVPPPLWMVAVPALELAAATCALGIALTIAITALTGRVAERAACGRSPAARR